MDLVRFAADLGLALRAYLLLAPGQFRRPIRLRGANASTSWPAVCAVVPARDDVDLVRTALPALPTHDYPALRVVPVGGGCEDATAGFTGDSAAHRWRGGDLWKRRAHASGPYRMAHAASA